MEGDDEFKERAREWIDHHSMVLRQKHAVKVATQSRSGVQDEYTVIVCFLQIKKKLGELELIHPHVLIQWLKQWDCTKDCHQARDMFPQVQLMADPRTA